MKFLIEKARQILEEMPNSYKNVGLSYETSKSSLRKVLNEMEAQLKDPNGPTLVTWYCQKDAIEVPKGDRCKICGKTKREKF